MYYLNVMSIWLLDDLIIKFISTYNVEDKNQYF